MTTPSVVSVRRQSLQKDVSATMSLEKIPFDLSDHPKLDSANYGFNLRVIMLCFGIATCQFRPCPSGD